MTRAATTETFLATLDRSGLVEPARLSAYLRSLNGSDRPTTPKALAQRLVADGVLTPFQAAQLHHGKWRGFVIGGRYRVLDSLGEGGRGKVFLCEPLGHRGLVTVKVLPPGKLADAEALAQFEREALAAIELRHPNLVRVLQVDADGPFHFLVMAHTHGLTLEQAVKKHGSMDVGRAADWIRQAATGLDHAHCSGLVHRDVQPASVLVEPDGTVKVLDLGPSKFTHDADTLTEEAQAGNINAAADYISPEQAAGNPAADYRADIYSLGATFYYLLAGRAPYHDGSLVQKLLWHQTRRPPSLRAFRPDVPEDLEALLSHMMAKDPDQRPQRAADVADLLEPFAAEPSPVAESDLPPLCPAIRRLTAAPGEEAVALPPAEAAIPPTLAHKTPTAGRPSWLLPAAALLGTFLGGLLVWQLWPPQPSSPPQPRPPKVAPQQP